MTQTQIYEGTPAELAEQLLSLPAARKYRMMLLPEQQDEAEYQSLDATIAQMTNRTPEEIAATRARILAANARPRDLPEGQTIFDAIMGKWPGDETDAEINTALETLS